MQIHSYTMQHFKMLSQDFKEYICIYHHHTKHLNTGIIYQSVQAHLSSPSVVSGVRAARSLMFCVMFCRSLFVLLPFFFLSLFCLSVCTTTDYSFDIFKLFLSNKVLIRLMDLYFWQILMSGGLHCLLLHKRICTAVL